MSNRAEKEKLRIEFISNYFDICDMNFQYAVNRTKKYNPAIKMPSRPTLYKWIEEHRTDYPHVDNYDEDDVESGVTVMAPCIAEQQKQLERDFLQMSILQLKDFFRDSILKTIVNQNNANEIMSEVLESITKDIKQELPLMDTEEKMKVLLVLGKAVKPFTDANKIYLEMLEKLKIKRKDLETIEKAEKLRKLDVNINVVRNDIIENETDEDGTEDE